MVQKSLLFLTLLICSCKPKEKELSIGDLYEGGYIIYLDETKHHGLLMPTFNGPGNLSWGCDTIDIVSASYINLGKGNSNTIEILKKCPNAPAAFACNQWGSVDTNNWFLPCKGEIEFIANSNRSKVKTGIALNDTTFFWTSSQLNDSMAWGYNNVLGFIKRHKSLKGFAQAIRKF